MVNLRNDWLMIMSLSGAVVSFYHVILMVYKMKPSVRALDFG